MAVLGRRLFVEIVALDADPDMIGGFLVPAGHFIFDLLTGSLAGDPGRGARTRRILAVAAAGAIALCPSECRGFSDPRQRLVEIGQEIGHILEPDGKPDEVRGDAQCESLRLGNPLMRGGRRMGDEAFGVAQIIGDIDDPEPVQEGEGACLAPRNLE